MATAAEISDLRLYINQPTDAEPWTDAVLSSLIDASGSPRAAASKYWEAEAAKVAHLVDISEGGSSRKMSDIHDNYLAMATRFASSAPGAASGVSGTQTRPASRG